jgi:transposase
MPDLTTLSRNELYALIYQQHDRIEALEGQLAEVLARLDKEGPPQPPSWIKANTKTKPKRRPKKRQHGYARRRDVPTEQVHHVYDTCPDCHGPLGKASVSYKRQVLEIPQAPVGSTEHIVYQRWCARCKKRVAPSVALTGTVVGKQRLGIRLVSLIAYLRKRCHLPLGVIQDYLTVVYQLTISEGAIVYALDTVAGKGLPVYEGLQTAIRGSPVVHADETGHRENGKNGYDWSFSTPSVHFLTYRKTRGQVVVEEVLGEEFDGILISDFYGGYNIYAGFHQRCWVHLLRDMHKLTSDNPEDKELACWAAAVYAMYKEACTWPGPAETTPAGKAVQERIEKQHEFEHRLLQVCKPYVGTDTPQRILCGRVMRFLPELFTFIRYEGVSADNNAAERMIRDTVVARKISGGTRSEKGSQTRVILSSLFDTWRLQGLNPLQACQVMLAA